MTDSMPTDMPAGLFQKDDLADPKRREDIARELKGVRWRMTVRGDYRPESPFGFLCHPSFPDNVFFTIRSLGSWAESGKLRPFTLLDAQVQPNFDKAKSCWGFAVSKSTKVSIPTELEIGLRGLDHKSAQDRQDDVGIGAQELVFHVRSGLGAERGGRNYDQGRPATTSSFRFISHERRHLGTRTIESSLSGHRSRQSAGDRRGREAGARRRESAQLFLQTRKTIGRIPCDASRFC